MGLNSIAAEYNKQLEAAHAQIDDDRYDMVECGAAGKPTLHLSYPLLACGIGSRPNYRMRTGKVRV